MPLTAILPLLPKELLGRTTAAAESHSYNLPKAVALDQLSRGAVKVQFGDLRRTAPSGVFVTGNNNDGRLVDLPLREILQQLHPEAFARRPGQNRITIPDDVMNLFGSKGERLTEVRVVDKTELKPGAARPGTTATPAQSASAAEQARARIPAPNLPTPIPFPSMGAVKPVASPVPTAKAPTAPTPSISAIPKVPLAPPMPMPKMPGAAPAFPKPTTSAPPIPPLAIRMPAAPAAPAPVQPAPQPVAAQVAPPAPASTLTGTLSLSLGTVSQKWPDSIRALIEQSGATDVEVPMELIEPALKLGRVAFLWQQVLTWLRPAPENELSLEEANTVLEMPLKVVAPLFLQKQKFKAKKSDVPEGIPDLFNAKGEKLEQEVPAAEAKVPEPRVAQRAPQPAAEEPVEAEEPTPPAARALVPAIQPERKKAESLGELFGEHNKKNWTPNEIVHKTITLPGVNGALIALQDGLLVAGCMPPPWKTETIAAFIPQIFGRLTQYTKELQMGDVKTVSFGVDTGTLQIFNAGIIYFAALGSTGATVPVDDLTLIANELSRHTK